MALTFWKFCEQAIIANNKEQYANSISLCNDALAHVSYASAPESIVSGRKNYVNNLMLYVSKMQEAKQAAGRVVDNTASISDSYVKPDNTILRKLQLENAELRKILIEGPSIDPLCIIDPTYSHAGEEKEDFGIVLFAHTRLDSLKAVLESLKRQDALKYTEVWLDGDQGNGAVRKKVNEAIALVKTYSVKRINSQRGNYGFRKMLLLGLSAMVNKYKDILILEDDCFPSNGAVKEFRLELDNIRDKADVFSVYGHHFGMEDLSSTFGRFQGWGWATTSEKLLPVLRQLIDCYSMSEHEYLSFVERYFTEDIKAKIEITPPRLPSQTLEKFFAWDETLCLLTAMNGQVHQPTRKRVIYNCGMGRDSTHFQANKMYRKPPFNMITPDEVWDYFD